MMNRIIHGDCIDHLRQLPDKSVTLLLTDPPYGLNIAWGGRSAATAAPSLQSLG